MKIHETIFASLYFYNKQNGEPDPWSICVLLTVSNSLNIMTIAIFIEKIFGTPVVILKEKEYWYLLFFLIFGLWYYLIIKTNRYKQINSEFKKLSNKVKFVWRFASITYFILSVLLLFVPIFAFN